ncbi:MAG: diphthamide biosynthesis enzyme Dph2 [Methanomassiliicoccales archaeon]|nr:diphthamide biosynthesis enzyme Dph2 [Methanomassiliicoccales archaeon]
MMDLQIDRAVEEIRARKAVVVGLQMPEGLKVRAREMAGQLENATGCQVIILGDPCYGACDLRSFDELDLLVHVGHAPMPDLVPNIPTVFLEVRMDFDVRKGLLENSDRIADRVGLVATAQHLHLLPQAEQVLREMGRQVLIGQGDARTAVPGQVLGCNVTSALALKGSVDQYIFLGSGYFHPLAVSLGTGAPVLSMDPYRGAVNDLGEMREKVIRQRYASMAKAKDAKDWVVIICDKPGQRRMSLARRCLGQLRDAGIRADIVQMNEVSAEALLPFRAEAAVSTACPRLAIDDGPHYPVPLLTPWEMEMVLGLQDMSDYRLDQILEGDTPARLNTTD